MPIKKEKNGTYTVDVSLGIDPITGKRIRTTRRGFKTKKSAERAQAELITQHNKHTFSSQSTMYFKDYINNFFLPWYKSYVKQSTYENRYLLIQKHFKYFDRLQLKQIQPITIQKWQTKLIEKYSKEYVRLLHAVLSTALNRAYKLGLILDNPARIAGNVKKQKKEVDFWTKEEFEKVIATIYRKDYYQHFIFISLWLLFMTGMRIGEASALQWSDIDLKKGIISITKTLYYKNANEYYFSTPKTLASRRKISIDDMSKNILKQWKSLQGKTVVSDFVLSFNGLPVRKSNIANAISRYSKLAHVHRIRVHALRHSHAAMLIQMGENALVIKERLGHEDIQTTLGTYGHLYPNSNIEVAQKLNGAIKIQSASSNLTSNVKNQFTKQLESNGSQT